MLRHVFSPFSFGPTCILSFVLVLQLGGCIRSPDPTKINCRNDDDCPPSHSCLEKIASFGKCKLNTDAAVSQKDSAGPLGLADGFDTPFTPTDGDIIYDVGKVNGSDADNHTGEKQHGESCGAGAHCQSGYCVGGICCDTACDGACSACTLVLTGKPDGTCAFVGDGKKDPKNTCVDETAKNQCGTDGFCDGTGLCRKVSATHVCSPATCSGSNFTPTATCDGKGACKTVTPIACGTSACDVTDGCRTSCEKDTACSSTSYCNSTTKHCAAKKIDGEPCSNPNECSAGFCADGVCCNTPCTDKCMACSNSLTGQKSGVCSAATIGTNPHDSCTVDTNNPCGSDGTCDGAKACHLRGTDFVCRPAACDSGNFIRATTCDGKGKCPTSTSEGCKGSLCSPTTGCQKTCTDSECTGQYYCDSTTKTCAPLKDKGVACTQSKECTSNFCIDGFCCNSACTDACTSCKNVDTNAGNGTCASVILGKPDPKKICTDERAADPCGNTGLCGSAGACQKADKSQICGKAICNGSNYTSASKCDGTGKCQAGGKTDCSPALCTLDGCSETCKANSDCSSAAYCDATGVCIGKHEPGWACETDGKKCLSGKCVDGVCCDSTCSGKCESCATGTCAATTTPRTPCVGAGTICGGSCNGIRRDDCVYPDMDTPCRNQSCSAGTQTNAATCTGLGSCAALSTKSCGAFGCNSSNTSCATSCPSGQIECGGTCVDNNTPAHCGSCTKVCSGTSQPYCLTSECVQCTTSSQCPATTPICTSNKCVQCTGDSHCSLPTPSCNSGNKCQCRIPKSTNLLQNKNPGFTNNISPWTSTLPTDTTFQTDDSDGCSGSGSIRIRYETSGNVSNFASPCLLVENKPYNFGFTYKQALAADLYCYVYFYAGSACSGGTTGSAAWNNMDVSDHGWESVSFQVVPPSAGSAMIVCWTTQSTGWFDQIFLDASSNKF